MDNQRGRVGIIVLLITVVMLTVGISVVSRTTTDVRISQTNEDASRALDAAEGAIEQALADSEAMTPGGSQLITRDGVSPDPANLEVSYDVSKLNYLETVVDEADVATLDLTTVSIGSNAQLRVAWAKEANCQTTPPPASLVVTIINQVGASPAVARRIFVSPCDRGAGASDGFVVIPRVPQDSYYTSTAIPLTANDRMVRLRPVYNQTALRISSLQNVSLSTQLFKITSRAQTVQGRETKSVEVDRSIPMPPALFDYVLYTGASITQ